MIVLCHHHHPCVSARFIHMHAATSIRVIIPIQPVWFCQEDPLVAECDPGFCRDFCLWISLIVQGTNMMCTGQSVAFFVLMLRRLCLYIESVQERFLVYIAFEGYWGGVGRPGILSFLYRFLDTGHVVLIQGEKIPIRHVRWFRNMNIFAERGREGSKAWEKGEGSPGNQVVDGRKQHVKNSGARESEKCCEVGFLHGKIQFMSTSHS
ncbi:Uncharacterized protein TCM_024755 [Theobroma cacao]|uniref:Uncharacterized protein n=1 Tax=Theobroma cacao TaxID=3641 RepID=A0A061EXE0_THECC|nr:Uncharacterized protein TCM_024755 [Theobroma cacao]